MNNTIVMYLCFVVVILLDLVAGYLKVIDSTIVVATFTGLVGVLTGIHINVPSSTASPVSPFPPSQNS